jgi:GTP-binding protein
MPGSTLTLDATVFTPAQLEPRLGPPSGRNEIALAGRSNVGKSSLLNALAGRRRLAKTSSTPGKTRSLNYYAVNPDGFWLVDLPGYGYARCSREEQKRWTELTNLYLERSPALRALLLLLDCRLPPQDSDQRLVAFARGRGLDLLPVLTRADQCPQRQQADRSRQWSPLLAGVEPLVVSSKSGRGLEDLWCALRDRAGNS